jgi:hypothetical protein
MKSFKSIDKKMQNSYNTYIKQEVNMALSVKGVKGFIGMEGRGFNATLYLNGKKVAFVIDSAQGGNIDYQWEGKTRDERDANESLVKKFIDSLPSTALDADAPEWKKSMYPDGMVKPDLDVVVCKLVDDVENEARLKRLKKTNVVFVTPNLSAGQMMTMKHNGNVEQAMEYLKKQHPVITFL